MPLLPGLPSSARFSAAGLLLLAACASPDSGWVHTRGVFEPSQAHAAPDVGLEYRTPTRSGRLQSVFGASLLDETDCQGHCGNYLFTGLRYPVVLNGIVDAGFGLSVGHYHAGEVELGSTLVARPGADVQVALGRGVTIGGYFHHFSSGHWGEQNPGAESAGLTLGWQF